MIVYYFFLIRQAFSGKVVIQVQLVQKDIIRCPSCRICRSNFGVDCRDHLQCSTKFRDHHYGERW
jgi:hypothetical protein